MLIETHELARYEYVTELVKRNSQGKCQLCGQTAPFKDKNNNPYLEIHHTQWLSHGGQDTVENTTALCPNCHRRMHILDSEKDKKHLSAL